MYIGGAILLFLLLSKCQTTEKKEATSSGGTAGDAVVTVTSGGGGGGGVPPNGDPDEVCENCQLIWIENSLSPLTPGFEIPEFVTKNGARVPASDGNAPTGHWECRGDCPLKNGNEQACKPFPKITNFNDFSNFRPHSRTELESLMECRCVLKDPCHIEYSNIFCDRGLPAELLESITTGNLKTANGDFMGITYAKIREHCGIAKCAGDCANAGDKCVFTTGSDNKLTCQCKGNTCAKVYDIFPIKSDLLNNADTLKIGSSVRLGDYAKLTTNINLNTPFHCEGGCVNTGEECQKSGSDCVCAPVVSSGIPKPNTCSQIQVTEDYDWWKCLDGYCPSAPFCYGGTSYTRGWYLGDKLLKADNDCFGAVAYCSAIGTRSQGWYDSSDHSLISYDNTCNAGSPCFYNGYTGKCACTQYTDKCAWVVDWSSYSGTMNNANHPYRDCKGSCYDVAVVKECKEVYAQYGDVCECKPTEGYGEEPPICYTHCQNLGYNGGRQVNSMSECTIPPEVPTVDNYNNVCCCFSISSGDDDMDDDGIPDNVDRCPTVPGYKLYYGCASALTTTPIVKTTFTTTTLIR